jgi:hypothetical protein
MSCRFVFSRWWRGEKCVCARPDAGGALRRAAALRDSAPLVVVLLTDGYNETHPLAEVDSALGELFAQGPTHVLVLGLSQFPKP